MTDRSHKSFDEFHDVHEFLKEEALTEVRRNQIFEANGLQEGLLFSDQMKRMDRYFFGEMEDDKKSQLDVIREMSEHSVQKSDKSKTIKGTGIGGGATGNGGTYKEMRPAVISVNNKSDQGDSNKIEDNLRTPAGSSLKMHESIISPRTDSVVTER
jgi:hypothetical protein